MKYRKKPVTIDAVPYEPGLEDGWIWDGHFYAKHSPMPASPDRKPAIATLEGPMVISPGDMIITGVKGERYPCKPDIFALTYEVADEAPIKSQLFANYGFLAPPDIDPDGSSFGSDP